jgi:hypothetical protein
MSHFIDKNTKKELPIVELHVTIKCVGFLSGMICRFTVDICRAAASSTSLIDISSLFTAETSITFVCVNNSTIDVEAELVFPLPNHDDVVCGYAIDLNGQLVDAVVVEKEQAR